MERRGYFPHEIRQLITSRIEALTPSDGFTPGRYEIGYAHSANDAWREALEPLVPEWEPSTTAHLAFFVDDRDIYDSAQHRSGRECPMTVSNYVIRFLFEMRPRYLVNDWDGAGKAAVDLYRWLVATDWTDACNILSTSRPINRAPIGSGEWLAVEIRLDVEFPLSLAEAL